MKHYTAVLPNGRRIFTTVPRMPEVLPELDLDSEVKTASRGLDSVEYVGRSRLFSAEEKRYFFTDCLPFEDRSDWRKVIKELRAKRETFMAISMAKMRQELVDSGELKPFKKVSKVSKRCANFPTCNTAKMIEELCPILVKWGM